MSSRRDLVIAVDLGGTRFRVAVVDAQGVIHERAAAPTQAEEGVEAVLERLKAAIRRVAAPSGWGRIAGLGLAAPGPIDPWTGVLYNPPNLPGWWEVPLKGIAEREFALPTFVGNDANLAALGEHRFGAGRGVGHLVYITVSTGIGGGIIAEGKLLLGAQGLAGEVGHMTILPAGPRCNCGNMGCLEALASGTAIARRAGERLREGAESSVVAWVGGDLTRVTAEMITRAAQEGDAFARQVVAEAASYLGIGVANLVHLFNPQMVILGGGVTNLGPLLFEPVRETVAQRTMAPFRGRLEIVPAALGDDVGLLGAAALVLDALAAHQR